MYLLLQLQPAVSGRERLPIALLQLWIGIMKSRSGNNGVAKLSYFGIDIIITGKCGSLCICRRYIRPSGHLSVFTPQACYSDSAVQLPYTPHSKSSLGFSVVSPPLQRFRATLLGLRIFQRALIREIAGQQVCVLP